MVLASGDPRLSYRFVLFEGRWLIYFQYPQLLLVVHTISTSPPPPPYHLQHQHHHRLHPLKSTFTLHLKLIRKISHSPRTDVRSHRIQDRSDRWDEQVVVTQRSMYRIHYRLFSILLLLHFPPILRIHFFFPHHPLLCPSSSRSSLVRLDTFRCPFPRDRSVSGQHGKNQREKNNRKTRVRREDREDETRVNRKYRSFRWMEMKGLLPIVCHKTHNQSQIDKNRLSQLTDIHSDNSTPKKV